MKSEMPWCPQRGVGHCDRPCSQEYAHGSPAFPGSTTRGRRPPRHRNRRRRQAVGGRGWTCLRQSSLPRFGWLGSRELLLLLDDSMVLLRRELICKLDLENSRWHSTSHVSF